MEQIKIFQSSDSSRELAQVQRELNHDMEIWQTINKNFEITGRSSSTAYHRSGTLIYSIVIFYKEK